MLDETVEISGLKEHLSAFIQEFQVCSRRVGTILELMLVELDTSIATCQDVQAILQRVQVRRNLWICF